MNPNTGQILSAEEIRNHPDRHQFVPIDRRQYEAMMRMGLEERVEHLEKARTPNPAAVKVPRESCGSACPSIKVKFKTRSVR